MIDFVCYGQRDKGEAGLPGNAGNTVADAGENWSIFPFLENKENTFLQQTDAQRVAKALILACKSIDIAS